MDKRAYEDSVARYQARPSQRLEMVRGRVSRAGVPAGAGTSLSTASNAIVEEGTGIVRIPYYVRAPPLPMGRAKSVDRGRPRSKSCLSRPPPPPARPGLTVAP